MSDDSADERPPNEYVTALRARGFELREQIGRGAFGVVYRATQKSLGDRSVAIKFYDQRRFADADNRKRFEREAGLLARLEHPAVPFVLTVGEVRLPDVAVPYHVMQFVPGRPLSHILSEQQRLGRSEALRIILPVLSALRHAHLKSIVHRDVCPDNILVSERSVFLLDFSIGFALRHEPGLTRATDSGERVGRADYAAPEQRMDSANVDHRVDIYSAGMVLFRMLAGHTTLRDVASDSSLGAAFIRRAIAKACAHAPESRYQSAAEFYWALYRSEGGLGTETPERTALCPSAKCPKAVWGDQGYFKGPRVDNTSAEFCDSCGATLVRSCPGCHASLPSNLRELTYNSKHGADSLQAFCVHCGELLYEIPTCQMCGSLLKGSDMGHDTKVEGCSKCRNRAAKTTAVEEFPF